LDGQLRQATASALTALQENIHRMAQQFAAGMAALERYANEEEAEVLLIDP